MLLVPVLALVLAGLLLLWLGGAPADAEAARPAGMPKPAFTEDGEATERPLLRYPLRRCIVELILLGLERGVVSNYGGMVAFVAIAMTGE